jgi:hypothetical protein
MLLRSALLCRSWTEEHMWSWSCNSSVIGYSNFDSVIRHAVTYIRFIWLYRLLLHLWPWIQNTGIALTPHSQTHQCFLLISECQSEWFIHQEKGPIACSNFSNNQWIPQPTLRVGFLLVYERMTFHLGSLFHLSRIHWCWNIPFTKPCSHLDTHYTTFGF